MKFKNESEVYNFWEKKNYFSADLKSKKRKYSLLIPPPNLTGELHLGHAMQHSILDAVARFRRLQGFDVLLLPGVDHAGIQFEATFDKHLSKQNLSKQKLGRDEWLKKAWQFKEEVYKSVSKSWRFMGLSADWKREVFTLDEKCQRAVFEEFKTYYDKGLIYKGPYIVQWCPKDKTAIEDVEMEYEERKEKLFFIRYKVLGVGEYITVATARPETIAADVAIAIYPNHPKYKKYLGKMAENPFTHTEIPIIQDERVEKDFGTGALKITPGHDLLDYQIGEDNNLPVLQVVDKEGRVTDIDPKLAGLKVLEAREKAAELLGDSVEKIEEYVHSVPVCERCKTVVEPLISEEWFVKVGGLAEGGLDLISKDSVKFLPPNYKKIISEWLSNIHDWCISRSLWWGHRIPVWYKGGESKVSFESPGDGWRQDEQVLDTWFSSGLWPLSTLGWPQESADLDAYFPWDFEISAPEIKYLWIARMIMISNYFTKKPPFKTMFFHGMLRDLEGRKFSKSLGNGIDPQYLIDQWGVDATRMALYTYSVPGRDGRVSKGILDERGKNFRNFATKIRNVSRFVLELKPQESSEVGTKHADDKWIEGELGRTVKNVTKHMENLELHLAVDVLYEFIWHQYADIYIEKSKTRRAEAQATLESVLKSCLIMLHPFMPFLTEELYQGFVDKKESIMIEAWPVSSKVK